MLDNTIYPSLEGLLLARPIVPPKRFEYALTCFIDVVQAKQVFQAILDVRESLHIEK